VRHIERRDNVSLDDILLCPEIASEFDAICCDISPGFSSLRYRWAALRLRKSRNLQPEILGHVVPTEVILIPVTNIALEEIPKAPGIYCFSSLKATLYVGEASCLRTRIKKHVVHSDNKYLARWIWEQGVEELTLELHVLKSSVATKVRKAMETELIRSRKPEFNVLGKLK
jgi:site-specific DNA-methyltransferase (adenine-specific)